MRIWPAPGPGRNPHDTRDEIPLTPLSLAPGHRVAPAATNVASARRSSRRKEERPRPTLRYGSAGTKSVHPTGTERNDPSGRSNVTRSSPQSGLATTNRKVCPRRGWNGWVIRISGGSTGLAVVDSLGESLRGTAHRLDLPRVPRPRRRARRAPPATAPNVRIGPTTTPCARIRRSSRILPSHGRCTPRPSGVWWRSRRSAGSITFTSARPDRGRSPGPRSPIRVTQHRSAGGVTRRTPWQGGGRAWRSGSQLRQMPTQAHTPHHASEDRTGQAEEVFDRDSYCLGLRSGGERRLLRIKLSESRWAISAHWRRHWRFAHPAGGARPKRRSHQ